MQRIIVLGLVLSASLSIAQGTPEIPNERVVVVPMGDPWDAGVAQPPPAPQAEPFLPQPTDTPVFQPETRTLEALPPAPPAENLDQAPLQIVPSGPGAMIDGHPREGAFLSGPGSLTFLIHHTLMTGFGVLGTQLIPRAIDASPAHAAVMAGPIDHQFVDIPAGGCDPANLDASIARNAAYKGVISCSDIVTGEGARLAYLTGTLIGAGIMALATLKFNPSTAQIIRANIFGAIVGGAVLVLSGLLLGPATGFTRSPVPYILAGVGSIGAKTLVSLLWADAAENPTTAGLPGEGSKYRSVW